MHRGLSINRRLAPADTFLSVLKLPTNRVSVKKAVLGSAKISTFSLVESKFFYVLGESAYKTSTNT